MSNPILSALTLAAVCFQALGHEIECAGVARLSAPVDSSEYRKYAPDRSVDILHLTIEVTPDFAHRSVKGVTTVRFKPLEAGLRELRLNAEDLRIEDVSGSAPLDFQNTGTELVVTFAEELPGGQEEEIAIRYQAFPRKGLYFRTKEMGYAPEDEHLFTQGEDIEARHWFPCYDSPNDKFTDDLICHVPEDMVALSNGSLISEESEGDGLKRVHWRQDKPHTSYLISLVVGHFKKVEDRYKNIPLAFYTPASQIDLAASSFRGTKEMLQFFEEEIGVPYPWDKYYQVCVQDFMWGGMENTSITTLTDNTLFPPENENLQDSEGLVAHELAHQWFGDLVTCKDWSQLWLNEGFATYYAHLWDQRRNGRDAFRYGLYKSAQGFVNRSVAQDSRPVVFRNYNAPIEMVGYLVYPKGGWILHMLRHELGEKLYRDCIRTYLERHRFGNVDTHDLNAVIQELSGRSFDQFFDQWVFHPHHPELSVRYNWDAQQKLARISVDQTQELTNGVALFRFPLTLRFRGDFGTVDRTIDVKEKSEPFFFSLPAAPQSVRIDPDLNLLARIRFEPTRAMAIQQLKDDSDVIGRVLALEQLSKADDQEAIDLIAERLRTDPFYGVRLDAAEALRKIHNPEALRALIESAKQEDARVRRSVVSLIATFYEPEARQFALDVLEHEANPEIRRAALRALEDDASPENHDRILAALRSDSFENGVALGAIAAARAQNDPTFIGPILDKLRTDERDFNARGLGSALDAAAYLARNEENKDAVYQMLIDRVKALREPVRVAAIRALGVLRDERALAILDSFTTGPADARETREAKKSVEAIRSQRPVVTEMRDLRTELLDLKKQNEAFRKELDELKKQTKAKSVEPPKAPAPAVESWRKISPK